MNVYGSHFPVSANFDSITRLQDRFENLQVQLATGKKASTLSDLGSDRNYDLTLRNRMSRIEAYSGSIQTVQLRLEMLSNVMSRSDDLEAEMRSMVSPGGYGAEGVNLSSAPKQAESKLSELVSLLNTEVNGRYLFGGNKTEAEPVRSVNVMLVGADGKAGFRTVAGERLLADKGPNGLGRLQIADSGTDVGLSEDGDHPFGFKLSTVSTDSGGVTVTQPGATQPRSLNVEFAGGVSAGEEIRIGLTLPDGSETSVKLTATTDSPPGNGRFEIGATATDTATNFAAALDTALKATVETDLDAASQFAAADNFFAASGEKVMRVAPPASPPAPANDFANATSLVEASESDTVFWYSGQDAPGAERETVSAQIDDTTNVKYGVQANESGFTSMVRSMAVMSVQNFSYGDGTSEQNFDFIASGQRARLSESNNSKDGSLEKIMLELGTAQSSTKLTQERNTAYNHQLENLLARVEDAPIEEVAMEISAIRTRLQASFQTVSMVSQLTLTNYLR